MKTDWRIATDPRGWRAEIVTGDATAGTFRSVAAFHGHSHEESRQTAEMVLAKLAERRTVHGWLDTLEIPQEEGGKKICLLRRLAIALKIHSGT